MELNETELGYLKNGNRVKAIIAYRQRTKVGFIAARDLVDKWLEETASVREEFDEAFDGAFEITL